MTTQTDEDDGDDDDDCPRIMRYKNSMHSMLVAQGRRDIRISRYNKLITNFRKRINKLNGKFNCAQTIDVTHDNERKPTTDNRDPSRLR